MSVPPRSGVHERAAPTSDVTRRNCSRPPSGDDLSGPDVEHARHLGARRAPGRRGSADRGPRRGGRGAWSSWSSCGSSSAGTPACRRCGSSGSASDVRSGARSRARPVPGHAWSTPSRSSTTRMACRLDSGPSGRSRPSGRCRALRPNPSAPCRRRCGAGGATAPRRPAGSRAGARGAPRRCLQRGCRRVGLEQHVAGLDVGADRARSPRPRTPLAGRPSATGLRPPTLIPRSNATYRFVPIRRTVPPPASRPGDVPCARGPLTEIAGPCAPWRYTNHSISTTAR